jgi:riboflavin biosynthesis pyrimidine reductase
LTRGVAITTRLLAETCREHHVKTRAGAAVCSMAINFLNLGLIDEIALGIAPVLLGDRIRR